MAPYGSTELVAQARRTLSRADRLYTRTVRFYVSATGIALLCLVLFFTYGVVRRHQLATELAAPFPGNETIVTPDYMVDLNYGSMSISLIIMSGICTAMFMAVRATGPLHLELSFAFLAIWLLYSAFTRHECICCEDRPFDKHAEYQPHHLDYLNSWIKSQQGCVYSNVIEWIQTTILVSIAVGMYTVSVRETDYFVVEKRARARLLHQALHHDAHDIENFLVGEDGQAFASETGTSSRLKLLEHDLSWVLRLVLLCLYVLVCLLPLHGNNADHLPLWSFLVRVALFIIVLMLRSINTFMRRRNIFALHDSFNVLRSRGGKQIHAIHPEILREPNDDTHYGKHTQAWPASLQYETQWSGEAQQWIETRREHYQNQTTTHVPIEAVSRWTNDAKREHLLHVLARVWMLQLWIDGMLASAPLWIGSDWALALVLVQLILELVFYKRSVKTFDEIHLRVDDLLKKHTTKE